jgi:hypothetical protein
MDMSGLLHALAILLLRKEPLVLSDRRQVVPRAGLDMMARKNIPAPARN